MTVTQEFIVIGLVVLTCVFDVVRVWNEAAAHRLITLGHSARQGDLVWRRGGQQKPEDTQETSSPQVGKEDTFSAVKKFLPPS